MKFVAMLRHHAHLQISESMSVMHLVDHWLANSSPNSTTV
jgi:hypothetical protein